MAAGTPGREQLRQRLLVFLLAPHRCLIQQQSELCSELYNVLCSGEGSLGGPMVLLTVQLSQLQNWHVAQGTHFPNLQPLNKALSVEGMLTRTNPQLISRLEVF